jgi:hypothetical protein
MKKFVKSAFGDPFLIDANDFNPGFFGHLNALVEAITALEENGGGGPGGNNISVFFGAAPKVTSLSKLTFSGNVTINEGATGEALINIPPIANGSIALGKLATMNPGLLGRYQAGTGPVQTISVGTGLALDPNTGILTSSGTATTVSEGVGITVTGAATNRTVALTPVGSASAGVALATISVDAYGRVTSAAAGSISTVTLSSGTITGVPSGGTDIVNKTFVETYVQGLLPKESVRLATTVNLPSLSGTAPIDGIRPTTDDRILVKNQTNTTQNGIYVVGATPLFTWTRATDADTVAKLISAYVFVQQGGTNADSGWVCTVDSGTIPTAPIPWIRFTSVSSYTAGEGIAFTNGTTINVKTTLDGVGVGKSPGGFGGTASSGLSSVIPKFAVDLTGRITSIENFNPLINLASNLNVGASVLTGTNGGTGFATYGKGDILYAAAAGSALSKLAVGSAAQVLTLSASLVPTWADAAGGLTNPMTTAGQMIYASSGSGAVGSGVPAIVPVATTDGFVLTYNTSANKPEWRVATGSNPTSTIGDIIYTSTTNSPGTLARLPIGTTGQYLRVNNTGGVLLPKWENGVTTGTVVSFVVDGYGGPIVAATPTQVFVVKIPFSATYTSLSISSDVPPGVGTIGLTVSGGTGSPIVATIPAGGTPQVQPGSQVFTGSGTLTFTVTNASTSAVTKLFVNLTGTRS